MAITTQLEMETTQEKNMEIVIETSRENIPFLEPIEIFRGTMTYNNLFDPFNNPLKLIPHQEILNIQLVAELKNKRAMLTASTINEIYKFLYKGSSNKNMYIRVPDTLDIKDQSRCLIATSLDKITHSLYFDDTQLPKYEQIGTVIIRDNSYKASINNLLFMLFCNIPDQQSIEFLKSIEYNWEEIKKHYKRFFGYDVSNISAEYARLLDTSYIPEVRPSVILGEELHGGNTMSHPDYYASYTMNKNMYAVIRSK